MLGVVVVAVVAVVVAVFLVVVVNVSPLMIHHNQIHPLLIV